MKFIITGTHAYGPVSENSDLDIVMHDLDGQELARFLVENDIQVTASKGKTEFEYDGYSFVLGGIFVGRTGIKINIIQVHTEAEFQDWNRRTAKMKKLLPIKDREERLKKFREG